MKQSRSGRSKHWMHMVKKEEMERKARASCLSLTPVYIPETKQSCINFYLSLLYPALLYSYIPNPLIVKRIKPLDHFQIWYSSPTVWKNSTRHPPRLLLIEGIQRKFSLLFYLAVFSSEPSAEEGWGIQCQALHLCNLWQSLTMTISPRERK